MFQVAGLIHPRLRAALLPRDLWVSNFQISACHVPGYVELPLTHPKHVGADPLRLASTADVVALRAAADGSGAFSGANDHGSNSRSEPGSGPLPPCVPETFGSLDERALPTGAIDDGDVAVALARIGHVRSVGRRSLCISRPVDLGNENEV